MDSILTYLSSDVPRWLHWVGGVCGVTASWLWGASAFGMLEALTTVALIDFVLGNIVAAKYGEWSSEAFFHGFFKKIVYFAVCAVAHMLDLVSEGALGFGYFEPFCVMALIFGEAGSVLENLDLLGYKLPPVLSKWLLISKSKLEDKATDKITGQ